MRKYLFFCIIVTLSWAANSWFLGNHTEQSFRSIINEINKTQLIQFELVHYRRNLLGANAKVILRSNNPVINQWFDELMLDLRVKHGPILVSDSGVGIGKSEWMISKTKVINKEGEEGLIKTKLPRLFIKMGFNKEAYYVLNDSIGSLEDMHGVYNFENGNNALSLSLNGIQFGNKKAQLATDTLHLSINNKEGLTGPNSLLNVVFEIPNITLQLKGFQKPIMTSLHGVSNIKINQGIVSGSIHADLKNVRETTHLVDSVVAEIDVQGIALNGLLTLLDGVKQRSDLRHQIMWVLLEGQGEFPEGQDQIWQHYDQIDSLSRQLPLIIENDILRANSGIAFNINLQGKSGSSIIVGELKKKAKGKVLKTGGDVFLNYASSKPVGAKKSLLAMLLAAIQGKAEIKLSEDLHKHLVNNSMIKRRHFNLLWKDNKLLMK